VLFDTCHAHMIAVEGSKQTGGPVERLKEGVLELARMLRGRIRTVHVGDSDGTVYQGGTSTHVPIGEGRIDFPPILEELAAHGGMTNPWWTLDLSNCENAWEAAASCKAALDRFNKAWLATAK
ncbi:MAG: TIM barrel protein, partial [Roseiarcus sp.]